MAKAAARVGDTHVCSETSPTPHGGGLIPIPGHSTVIIGGQPAVTVGSPCKCTGAPELDNIIDSGSSTVFICGAPAARVTDSTLHGGRIMTGEGTVLIGDAAAISAVNIFPGTQKFGNCALQCIAQIIHQTTDQQQDEEKLFNLAKDNNRCGPDGAVDPSSIQDLVNDLAMDAQVYQIAFYQATAGTALKTVEDLLTDALELNQGVIVSVNSDLLWNSSEAGVAPDHAVLVTEGDFDEDGQLTHVYINDTGALPHNQVRRQLTKDQLLGLMPLEYQGGNDYYSILITKDPIWTRVATPRS